MFKSLGNSFVDTFKKPLNIVYTYLFMVGFSLLYYLLSNYTFDFMPTENLTIFSLILYIIKNYFWIFCLYLVLFIVFFLFMSIIVTYILNKKQNLKGISGTSKIFGFLIFLSLISLIPTIVFEVFSGSLVFVLIFFIISLIYILFIYPYLFIVPVLLLTKDLKSSLFEASRFAKTHYWWIIVIQFLAVIVLGVLSQVFDYLSTFLTEIGSMLLFLLLLSLIFLWGLNFIYNWYNAEKS